MQNDIHNNMSPLLFDCTITPVRYELTCYVVILRLHEIQWCGVQRGKTELLLRFDLPELGQHH